MTYSPTTNLTILRVLLEAVEGSMVIFELISSDAARRYEDTP